MKISDQQKLYFYEEISTLKSQDEVLNFFCDFLVKNCAFSSLVLYLVKNTEILSIEKLFLPKQYEALANQYQNSEIELANHEIFQDVLEKNQPLILTAEQLRNLPNSLKSRVELWHLKENLEWVIVFPLSDQKEQPLGILVINSIFSSKPQEILDFVLVFFRMIFRRVPSEWKIRKQEDKKEHLMLAQNKYKRLLELASELNMLRSSSEITGFILQEFLEIFEFEMGVIQFEDRGRLIVQKVVVSTSQLEDFALQEMAYFGDWENAYDVSDPKNPEGACAMAYLDNKYYYLENVQALIAGGVKLNPKDAKALQMLNNQLITIIHIPIRDRIKPIGILQLRSLSKTISLSVEDIKLMEDLCSFLPSILRNASLHDKILNQEQELSVMNEKLKVQNIMISKRNQQIEEDLKLAQRIQLQLLPRESPGFPGMHIAHLYKPLEEIGGDFYDYLKYKEPHLIGFFISDVSGHGVSAALITTMLKTLMETSGINRLNPEIMFKYINLKLIHHIGGNFLTAFYGILNTITKEFLYTRAAHPYPYVIRGGTLIALDGKGTTVLGAMQDIPFYSHSIQLEAGDKLFLYTDGLSEAVNKDFNEFGEYLEDLLIQHSEFDVQEIIKIIYNELLDHCEEEDFEDDVCMLCIQI